MKQHEQIMAEIDSELAAFGSVLDEYEETLAEVDETLTNSKFDTTEEITARTERTNNVSPAGAD